MKFTSLKKQNNRNGKSCKKHLRDLVRRNNSIFEHLENEKQTQLSYFKRTSEALLETQNEINLKNQKKIKNVLNIFQNIEAANY